MKIWQCYSGLAAQTWYYTDDNRIALENQGTSLAILTAICRMTDATRIGQCLDLTNGSSADGNVMQIWACTTNDSNQAWTT